MNTSTYQLWGHEKSLHSEETYKPGANT